MNGDKRQLKASAVAEIAKIEEQLREWDPLGVSPGEVAPSDEYDSYAPAIASLIRRGGSVDAVAL